MKKQAHVKIENVKIWRFNLTLPVVIMDIISYEQVHQLHQRFNYSAQ